jgi:hypothetical protein
MRERKGEGGGRTRAYGKSRDVWLVPTHFLRVQNKNVVLLFFFVPPAKCKYLTLW